MTHGALTRGAVTRGTAIHGLLLAAGLGAAACCAATPATPAPVTTPAAPPRFEIVRDRAGLVAAFTTAAEQPVLLDVTATWCVPCAELTHETFADPRVVARLADHRWIALDVSDGTDEQVALQAFFGGNALPRMVLWSNAAPVLASLRGGDAAAPVGTLEISTFVTADELLAAIETPR